MAKKRLTKKQRSAAAKKGWETRRKNKLNLQTKQEIRLPLSKGKKAALTRKINIERVKQGLPKVYGKEAALIIAHSAEEIPVETHKDVYEGIISEIYLTFNGSRIAEKLEEIMQDTVEAENLNINGYVNKLDLNKISKCLEIIQYDSDITKVKASITELAEELSLGDLHPISREELSELIEMEY